MTNAAESEWTVEPFRMGTADEFTRLRELFVRARFTEAEVCAVAGVQSMHHFPAGAARTAFPDATDVQSLLVRLFLDCATVGWTTVRDILSPEDLATVESLGLLHTMPGKAHEPTCQATVSLYPTNGVYVASDRYVDLHITGELPPADLVYSAMTQGTNQVLTLMPRVPCEEFLELCSGTGVAALIAASTFATRAVAIDITERSTRFARFNIALNGLSNVTAEQGDVYGPLSGRTFDAIVAHPPYVPNFETEFAYRDGGEDGEQVTRRTIAGLGEYLRPGGQFYCSAMLSDRVGAPIEARAREMLGARADEFDVIIGEGKSHEPDAYYAAQAREGKISFSSLERRHEAYAHLGIERFVTMSLLVRRLEAPRPVMTTRRLLSTRTTAADFQWLLHWGSTTASWTADDTRRLLDSRPRAAPTVELRTRSVLKGNKWQMDKCELVTAVPFAVEASCPNWFATLMSWCDGRATARDHLARLQEAGIVLRGASEAEFAGMIRLLVDSGLVEVDEFRPPEASPVRGLGTLRVSNVSNLRIDQRDRGEIGNESVIVP